MNKINNNFIFILKKWTAFIVAFVLVFSIAFLRLRPLIFDYAQSTAENILIKASDQAVLEVLREMNISYDDISHISRNSDGSFSGIEIDVVNINTLKCAISDKIKDIIKSKEFYEINIPLGILMGFDVITGTGPYINLKMRLSETSLLNYTSEFSDAGINQVLHRITINLKLNGSMVMVGLNRSFNVETNVIAAQTVIVGKVPESFTEVDETPGADVADDIFNFSDH